jgi:CspA family cold shock protein
METGTVKWFSAEKGFGFIEPAEGGQDVFVHKSNIIGLSWDEGLRDGESVEFEVESTEKGLSALNVQRMN